MYCIVKTLSLDHVWAYLEDTMIPAIYSQPSLVPTHTSISNTTLSYNVSAVVSLNSTINTTTSPAFIHNGGALHNLSFVESASLLLGARLRQLRVAPVRCSNAIAASLGQYITAKCYPEYSVSVEDRSSASWDNLSTVTGDEFVYR